MTDPTNAATVSHTCYRLADDGKTLIEGVGPVKSCEAVFIKAESDFDIATFTRYIVYPDK